MGQPQPYVQQKGEAQHANLISEGALSQLINSHIHETGDGPTQQYNEHSFATDSYENGGNLAFWARKQNEYKANLIN